MNWENERSPTKCCFCGQVIEMLAVLVHKLMEHLNDRLIPHMHESLWHELQTVSDFKQIVRSYGYHARSPC
ncbi:hypothetical protein Tsp_11928, partial [Trichinella spiralis]|uniref:hypothetical protein n=1 Tax=Trichinella spiralis TaxID=6334 RepID=UPI0001EFD205